MLGIAYASGVNELLDTHGCLLLFVLFCILRAGKRVRCSLAVKITPNADFDMTTVPSLIVYSIEKC